MNKQYARVGTNTVAAGGTAETVVLGFQPSYVRAVNVNNLATYEHWSGMADGTSIDTGFTLGADICDTTSDVVRRAAIR